MIIFVPYFDVFLEEMIITIKFLYTLFFEWNLHECFSFEVSGSGFRSKVVFCILKLLIYL